MTLAIRVLRRTRALPLMVLLLWAVQLRAEQPAEGLADVPKGTIAYLDSRNGFRDLSFGSSLSKLKGASKSGFLLVTPEFFYQPLLAGSPHEYYKEEVREWLACYERAADTGKIGETETSTPRYCYYKDHLVTVHINAGGDPLAVEGFVADLKGIWGPPVFHQTPDKPYRSGEFVWSGQRVHAQLEVWETGSTSLYITSREAAKGYFSENDSRERARRSQRRQRAEKDL